MQAIIIGATSFIGKTIINVLSSSDINLIGTYKTNDSTVEKLKNSCPNAEFYNLDVSQENDFKKLPDTPEALIYASGISEGMGKSESEMLSCNIIGVINAVQYCLKNRVSKIVYLSSMSVYGLIETSLVTDSTPINKPNFYGQTKLEGERIFTASKIPTVAIRLPGVLGLGASRAWLPSTCDKLFKNHDVEIFNSESSFNNLIGVDDLSRFILSLLQRPLWHGFHAFPVGAKDGMKIREVVEIAKSRLKSKSKIVNKSSKTRMFNIDSSYAMNNFGYLPKSSKDILDDYLSTFKS